MIQDEIKERLQKFQGMTAQEESALLSISNAQRQLVASNDKKLKSEFLATAPHITHGAVKNNDKYKSYMGMVQAATNK